MSCHMNDNFGWIVFNIRRNEDGGVVEAEDRQGFTRNGIGFREFRSSRVIELKLTARCKRKSSTS